MTHSWESKGAPVELLLSSGPSLTMEPPRRTLTSVGQIRIRIRIHIQKSGAMLREAVGVFCAVIDSYRLMNLMKCCVSIAPNRVQLAATSLTRLVRLCLRLNRIEKPLHINLQTLTRVCVNFALLTRCRCCG